MINIHPLPFRNLFFFSSLALIFSLSGCNEKAEETEFNTEKEAPITHVPQKDKTSGYTMQTENIDSIGWGYKIYLNDALFIHQKQIPSIPGNKGFSTQEKAEITGNYILKKLNEGQFPPSVTKDELESLKVL